MKLNQIEELQPLIVGGQTDIEFGGINLDSRHVKRGDLFAAVDGFRDDGFKYISSAFERGASGALTTRDPSFSGARCVQVTDVRHATALIASALQGWPARQMNVFAVTGTNGKTTSAWLLREMLQSVGQSVGLFSTVTIEYPGREIPAQRTTPDACTLQQLLAEMRRANCDSVVMECSSHALHQSRVAGIPFAGAIFTNLSQDHLDYHQNMDDYFKAKLLLFQQMASLNSGAPAVCCIDSEYGCRMADAIRALDAQLITVGFNADADLRIDNLKCSAQNTTFKLDGCGVSNFAVSTLLTGRYNAQNIAGAAAIASACGVPWDNIACSVAHEQPRWGRLERVVLGDCEFSAFVDYAHTDDALKSVLSALREITAARIIVVFGCGGDRDRTKRPLMGSVCAALADIAIVTSDNPRSENPDDIIRDILEGMNRGARVLVEPDRRVAIRLALQQALPGDVVLIAGKGHECFQEYGSRSLPFDDRQVLIEEFRYLRDVSDEG